MEGKSMSERERVLITGGAGFIGRWLVDRFLSEGAAVHVVDDLSTGALSNLPEHEALVVSVGSVLDGEFLDGCFAWGPTLVVHLAGIVGMRLAHARRLDSYQVAVQGAREVLNRSECPVLLASSSAVYGLTDGVAVSERAPLRREDVVAYDGGVAGYALGKFEAEAVAREFCAAGGKALSVRFFNVVGPMQSGRFGMVLPTFVQAALAGEDLVLHGDGSQTRSFSAVETVCDCVWRLSRRLELFDGRALNIGSPQCHSIGELARAIVAGTGSRSQIRYVPYESVFPGRSDVRGRRPDIAELERLLGPVQWPDLDAIVDSVLRTSLRASA